MHTTLITAAAEAANGGRTLSATTTIIMAIALTLCLVALIAPPYLAARPPKPARRKARGLLPHRHGL